MSTLDLADIQGDIHRPYGRYGFPYARYVLFHIARDGGDAGRWFVDQLRHYVTTAEPWSSSRTAGRDGLREKPPVALNIAFTWWGLQALDLPIRTLQGLPEEFIEGMACRNHILGDLGDSDPKTWDPVWRQAEGPNGKRIHIMVALNAQAKPDGAPVEALQTWTDWLQALCANPRARGKVELLPGHGRDGKGLWQESRTLMQRHPETGCLVPTPYEHFGFMDGISDPVFEGQGVLDEDPLAHIGSGKLVPGGRSSHWEPLATGEFILGHPSEGQEMPRAAAPHALLRNGTFMAVRKLHQNTRRFRDAIEAHARHYQQVARLETPEEARETLLAKMVGRWRSGVPLMVAPTYQEMLRLLEGYPLLQRQQAGETLKATEARAARDELRRFERQAHDYRYGDDPEGMKCPLGAHVRRANPRDMLDCDPVRDPRTGQVLSTGSSLVNRRRILRRGLPYGEPSDNDADEHGVFIMAVCASLFRQFEFIQQQWLHYGLDMESGNDTCPITGSRGQSAKFVIPAGAEGEGLPYVAAKLPLFVETRGGEYFFIPSLSALRMIAMGEIDPT